MLFELLPDYFPPFLTETETKLWEMYYAEIKDTTGSSRGR